MTRAGRRRGGGRTEGEGPLGASAQQTNAALADRGLGGTNPEAQNPSGSPPSSALAS